MQDSESLTLIEVTVDGSERGVLKPSEVLGVSLALSEDNDLFVFVCGDVVLDDCVLLLFGVADHADVLDALRDLDRV